MCAHSCCPPNATQLVAHTLLLTLQARAPSSTLAFTMPWPLMGILQQEACEMQEEESVPACVLVQACASPAGESVVAKTHVALYAFVSK